MQVSRSTFCAKGFACAATIALALLALPLPCASARKVLVANANSSAVSVFDSRTDRLLAPIDIGGAGSYASLAIAPDGSRAYAGRAGTKDVVAIDLQAGHVVGDPMPIGAIPVAIAITPDGKRAYVVDGGSENELLETISVLDLQTNEVLGGPIKVGRGPSAIAITPDGTKAYVVNQFSNSVSVLDTRSNTVIGQPIDIAEQPTGIAITPDGSHAYVTSQVSDVASVIDSRTDKVVGEPIALPSGSFPIAISPDGARAYVTSTNHFVSVIDTRSNQVLPGIPNVGEPEFIAITPDGGTAYFGDPETGTVSVFNIAAEQFGAPIAVGAGVAQIAVTPDQPPTAAFTVARARPGVPAVFDASGSTDPDGTVAAYAWDFGDEGTASLRAPRTDHAYAKPGSYRATLTLTDDEGCSTSFVFTGQTAYCNGASRASRTEVVDVAYPGVRVSCPKTARPGGCRFSLFVVTKRPKGGGGHKVRPESGVARVRVRAGHSGVVSLRPKQAFAERLATAESVLVKETRTIGHNRSIRFRRLKIVQ